MNRAQVTIANVATRNNRRNLLLTCFSLTVLFAAIVSQPAYAVGPAANRYAYVVDQAAANVLEYSITPATGALVPLLGCPPLPPLVAPNQAQVDPTGSFLYVADPKLGGGAILEYTIAPATGCLAPAVPFVTLSLNPGASHIHITSNGQYIYVSDIGLGGAVEGFSITPGTGALVPVPGAPIPTPAADKLVIDDIGNFVYVAENQANGLIAGFTFNPFNGALAPLPPTPAGPFPEGIAFDEAGQFLLVTNAVAAGTLTTYPVLLGGGLGVPSPIATGNTPVAAAVSPFGQCAFAANSLGNNVSQYLITPGTGVPLLNAPAHPTVKIKPVAMRRDPTGRYLYVVDNTGWVNGFTISDATCGLGNIATQPWAAGIAPVSIAVTP